MLKRFGESQDEVLPLRPGGRVFVEGSHRAVLTQSVGMGVQKDRGRGRSVHVTSRPAHVTTTDLRTGRPRDPLHKGSLGEPRVTVTRLTSSDGDPTEGRGYKSR